MIKAKKLSNKELEKIKSEMRRWDSSCYSRLAEIFAHITWLENSLKRSEEDARAIRQTHMLFEGAPIPYDPPPRRDFSNVQTLKERIIEMIKAGHTDTDKWRLTLKFSGISHNDALAMGNIIEGEI